MATTMGLNAISKSAFDWAFRFSDKKCHYDIMEGMEVKIG